ncbi:PHB depolymerase family esterase [Dyella japonica]|uniref:Pimeloyl-ACP methyl ester carboxylesterase n=1 Tax=Dyella japonica TaxID=231455 RepID=A0ABV2JWM4_9GAMM
MIRRGLSLACIAWLALTASASEVSTGTLKDVVFSQYTDWSSSAELARRLVTPLNAWRLQQHAASQGMTIAEQPIDLARERFALYVPTQMPPDGYALLVFVPPWNEASVPAAWTSILERHGMILVTAANIGNDASLLDRRDPVSLLAASNVMARYRVNPQRVYVGGFSGGSRVALRLALGYPDVFHGVLLEAGSDVLGQTVPLPPRTLLERFQSSTRIVYFTGLQDTAHQDADKQSRASLRHWCIDDVDVRPMPWTGHDLAEPAALDRALTSLETHRAPDAAKLDACRARVAHDIDEALGQIGTAIANGQLDSAKEQLENADQRYGGLAAPRSVQLATQLQRAAPPTP